MSVPTRESIYCLIPPPPPRVVRPPRHKSKFSDSVREETRHLKSNAKTLGPAKVPTNKPTDYLKKHSKEPKLPENSTFKYTCKKKPHVPPHTEQPQLAGKSTKNFITTNAIANITTVSKKPVPRYVDAPTGATHNLEPSGLMPKYCTKKDYGKVPPYLDQRKKEMAEAQAEYDRHVRECLERGQMQQLSGDERATILEGLKKNWEKLHHEFQGLSVVTDTPSKKARKERMEAEMQQLEKDIELVERHPVIYVGNDDQ